MRELIITAVVLAALCAATASAYIVHGVVSRQGGTPTVIVSSSGMDWGDNWGGNWQ